MDDITFGEMTFEEILSQILPRYCEKAEYNPLIEELLSHILKIKADLLQEYLQQNINNLPQEIQDLLTAIESEDK